MYIRELYKQYLDAAKKRYEQEVKIEIFIEKWKKGEIILSEASVQQAMEKAYERLENFKKKEEQLHNDFMNHELREDEKRSSDIAIQYLLGIQPTDVKIVDGVLSSKAGESRLIAEKKSPEQLESEKQELLTKLKEKVLRGEISLTLASKLTNDINNSYDFYSCDEKSSGMKK